MAELGTLKKSPTGARYPLGKINRPKILRIVKR